MQKKNSLLLKKIIILIIFILFQNNSYSNNMILDQLKNPNLTNQSEKWTFITDQVMGGVSTGKFEVTGSKKMVVATGLEPVTLAL